MALRGGAQPENRAAVTRDEILPPCFRIFFQRECRSFPMEYTSNQWCSIDFGGGRFSPSEIGKVPRIAAAEWLHAVGRRLRYESVFLRVISKRTRRATSPLAGSAARTGALGLNPVKVIG